MARLTLGFYDESRSRGGTTRYLLDLLACLDRDQFAPVFYALRPYEWHEELAALEVPVITALPAPMEETILATASTPSTAAAKTPPSLKRRVRWALGMAMDTRTLAGMWRQHPIDLLHINLCGTEPAPIAARLAGITRIVGVYHISPSYDLEGVRRGQPYRALETWALRSQHAAIACSQFTQRDWEAHFPVPPGLMTTVQNGIDLARCERTQSREAAKSALGFAAGDPLIGCVANLHPYKGHQHLIQAMLRVIKHHPTARLALAGTGALAESLQAQIDRLDLRRNITLLGYCADVRALLEALDLYVQPSVMEALGLAVLEASGMGLPVIASEIGGLPEVVVPEETGLLCPPKDANALADAMLRLLASPETAAQFGQAGAVMVRSRFTRERMTEETVRVYERVLGSAVPRANVPAGVA